jgi:hypothetical protein
VRKNTYIKVLGLALCAVFALSAYAAASAFAESEWLWQGSPIPAGQELPTDTEGTLTLSVLNAAGALVNEIDCSSLFEGTVLAGGIDLVIDIYSLPPAQVLIEELPGTSLSCETLVDNGACRLTTEAGSETLLWVEELSLALGLTWESLIELDAGVTFLDRFHHVAFELLCILLSGATLESLCEGTTSGALANVVGGVLIELGAAAGSEALTCFNKVGEVEVEKTTTDLTGDLVIKPSAGTLTVS